MKIWNVLCLASVVCSCQTGMVPISQRELYEKEGKYPSFSSRRPVEDKSEPGPEVYVKKESNTIISKEAPNYSGSLFSLKNPQGFLYSPRPRGQLGDFLEIQVASNRKESAAPNAAQAAGSTPQNPAQKGAASPDDLLASIPNLEPSDAKAKVPNFIKMQVVREFENGDVLLEGERASTNDQESHVIKFQARLPGARKIANEPVRTSDLEDVSWTESLAGKITQRDSSLWEDEYTLRLAGFDEARSKPALDLENKRKDLEKVKGRLQEKIASFNKERDQVLKEREKSNKTKVDSEQKVNVLNKALEEKDALIEQQKEAIKKQEELISSMKSGSKEVKK